MHIIYYLINVMAQSCSRQGCRILALTHFGLSTCPSHTTDADLQAATQRFTMGNLDADLPDDMDDMDDIASMSSEVDTVLPVVVLTESTASQHGECTICMSEFSEGQEATHLACTHTFHTRCITQWVDDYRHNTCPMCRAPVH